MSDDDTNDREVEEKLEEGRLTTTPEQDGRVMATAGGQLRRSRWWLVAPAVAAAAVLVLGATLIIPTAQRADRTAPAVADHTGVAANPKLPTVVGPPVSKPARPAGSEAMVLKTKVRSLDRISKGKVAGRARRVIGYLDREGSEVGFPPEPGEEGNTEGYDAIVENAFKDPLREALSTFSIDVDTASMSNVRRILGDGRLPPAGAVRIEEMINYFSYDYPDPEWEHPFSVTVEIAECPWNPRHRLVHIGLQGRRMPIDQLPPRNLVFLLDVSGSMNSAKKLGLVIDAMKLLVNQLGPNDHVGIVVYAGASGVVLEPTRGDDRQTILSALTALRAGGSTNAGAGIQAAYALARRNFDERAINRVILATDGDFNVGVTNRSDLLKLIEKERADGIFLTVLGVGRGNLKDSQMEMLADKGNGNYAYLDSIAEARKVLVEEAGATLVTIAKDVKIQVEWNPHRVGSYRLIGYENRMLAARDFNDDTKDAGEIGAGHSVTALYEITPPDERPGGVDPLKYRDPPAPSPNAYGDEVLTLKLRYKPPESDTSRLLEHPIRDPENVSATAASDDFRFSAAVAAFGLILRDSKYRGDASFALVRELAHSALGEDPNGHRRAFLELVATAEKIAGK